MVALVVMAILLVAGLEGWPLARSQRWPELAVFTAFIALALAIIVMDMVTYAPFRVSQIVVYVFYPYWKLLTSGLH